MEAYKKQVLQKSWQETAYQQAIWRARRRLAGKQNGSIDHLEFKILEENLRSESKPDFSRWADYEILKKSMTLPKYEANFNDENNVQESHHEDPSYAEAYSPVLEYLSVVDQAPLHKAYQEKSVNASNSFSDFGLCVGCFHKKGPHYHYHAPVRIGGGYSIYQRPNTLPLPDYESEVNLDTIKWLAELGKETDNQSNSFGFSDDYSARLFHQYVNKGGDSAAVKEFLDSNFDPRVLEHLRSAGTDVNLLQEYTELYRKHIKTLLQENIHKQTKVVEKHVETLDLAVMYTSIENDGANMEMLLSLIKRGRSSSELLKFESVGGNIEILEHFAQQINSDPSRDLIVSEFEKFLEKDNQHKQAQQFMNYLKSGGDLKTLKACVKEEKYNVIEALSQLSPFKNNLLRNLMRNFKNDKEFLNELKYFLHNHLHLYQGAELLQEYIEGEGKIKILKEFVEAEGNVVVVDQSGEMDFHLLNKVGEQFLNNPQLTKILEEFPEDQQLIEIYLQTGGSFPFLVKAISLATESPRLEEFVNQETKKQAKKLKRTSRGFNCDNSSSNSARPLICHDLPTLLLPRILEKAKADLIYSELIDSESNLKHNEGIYLSKSMDLQNLVASPALSSVNITERQKILRVYQSLASSHASSSSFSSVSDKRKKKLWKAPKPFEIKESHRVLTNPRSPFTRRRIFDISSLSEDRITDAAKQQRRQLDALKRNIRIAEFQKNWKVSITSPSGSVISAESKTETDKESLLDEVIAKGLPSQKTKAAPVDKKSRRQRQREKMKAKKVLESDGKASKKQQTVSNVLALPASNLALSDGLPATTKMFKEKNEGKSSMIRVQEGISKKMPKEAKPAKEMQPARKIEEEPAPHVEIEEEKVSAPVPETSEVSSYHPQPKPTGGILSPRYATAFGPKGLTSGSYSSFLSANAMRKMRDNPETMVASLDAKEKLVSSKSDSNLSTLNRRLQAEEKLNRALLRQRQSIPRIERKASDAKSDESDYHPQEDLIDLLKQFCIIREDRLQAYKRVFQKYVLIKSVREGEKNLENRRQQKNFEIELENEIQDSTLEGQLRKNEVLLRNVRENIKELHYQIAVAKDDVSKARARVAYRKVGSSLIPVSEDDISTHLGSHAAVSLERKRELLNELSANERRMCESDVEVRERKVALAHLRAKVKTLKTREKSLKDSSKRLSKLIEKEMIEKGFQKRQKHEFTRTQSRLYRELHPLSENVIDSCDLRHALAELDNNLTFFDHTHLSQTYYDCLLGPGLDVLRVELEAAGIEKKQIDVIVRKLSRGTDTGKLEFVDFVAYSPLFLTGHNRIVANPLAS